MNLDLHDAYVRACEAQDLVTDVASHLDKAEIDEEDDLRRAGSLLQTMTELGRELSLARAVLEDKLGKAMGRKLVVVEDLGALERHRSTTYRSDADQSSDLLRAVLDSRVVDKDTGEVRDETPVDKIRAVWALAARDARVTALRERNLAKDEFCTVEIGTWKIQIK